MATTTNRLTYDDLVAMQDLPEYEHARLEIIDGELFVAATPTPFHQRVIINVVYAFEPIVRSRRLGVIYTAPLTVRLAPGTAIEPDILYIDWSRRQIVGPKVVDGAPDLVMEMLSPETRNRDLTEKKDRYRRAGVREYWIIDLTTRAVTIFSLVDAQYVEVPVIDEVARSIVVPEFSITLDELFDSPA